MYTYNIRVYIFLFLAIYSKNAFSQKKSLNLEGAIEIAQKNSFDYRVAFNRYQSNLWNFRIYKSSFFPTLILDGIIPNYSRSINRITLPSGEDTFVSQNQAYSSLNLGIRQNVSATGGVISVGSTLSRIDVFYNNRQTNYSTVPVSISYMQQTVGFNNFKWLNKTEPVRYEMAKRELVSSMQEIGSQTVENYFNMIASQTQQSLSKQNLANTDTLNRIAKDRFKLGTVSQSELLQLRLNILNAQNKLREDSINFVLARQQFSRYLLIDDEERSLEIPNKIKFYEIQFQDGLEQAKNNSKAVIDFRLKRLEAERNLAQVKAENKLKFNVQANFGLSNASSHFPTLYANLVNQQNISVGFSVPLLDWGVAKTQKLRAEANLEMVRSEVEQQQMQLEQEIALQTSKWNMHQKVIEAAIEAKEIAEKNYEIEVQRYRKGSISINDLNAAQNQKDSASGFYIQALKTYWILYYTIRKLTLYDFQKKEVIVIAN